MSLTSPLTVSFHNSTDTTKKEPTVLMVDTQTGGIQYSYSPPLTSLNDVYIPSTTVSTVAPYTIVSDTNETYIVAINNYIWAKGTLRMDSEQDRVIFSIFKLDQNGNVMNDDMSEIRLTIRGKSFSSYSMEQNVSGNYVSILKQDLVSHYGSTTKFYVKLYNTKNELYTNRGEVKYTAATLPSSPPGTNELSIYKLTNQNSVYASLSLDTNTNDATRPLGIIWSLFTVDGQDVTEINVSEVKTYAQPTDDVNPNHYSLYNAEYNDETKTQLDYADRKPLAYGTNYFASANIYYLNGCKGVTNPTSDAPKGFTWDFTCNPIEDPLLTQSGDGSDLTLTGKVHVPKMSTTEITEPDTEVHPTGIVVVVTDGLINYFKKLYDFTPTGSDHSLAYPVNGVDFGDSNGDVLINKALGKDGWYTNATITNNDVATFESGVESINFNEDKTYDIRVYVINGTDADHVSTSVPINVQNLGKVEIVDDFTLTNGNSMQYTNKIGILLQNSLDARTQTQFKEYRLYVNGVEGSSISNGIQYDLDADENVSYSIGVKIGVNPYVYSPTGITQSETTLWGDLSPVKQGFCYIKDYEFEDYPYSANLSFKSNSLSDAVLFGGYTALYTDINVLSEAITMKHAIQVYDTSPLTTPIFSADDTSTLSTDEIIASNNKTVTKYTSEVSKQSFTSTGGTLDYITASVTGPNSKLELYHELDGGLGTMIATSITTTPLSSTISYKFPAGIVLEAKKYFFKVIDGSAHIALPGTYEGGEFSNQTFTGGDMEFFVFKLDNGIPILDTGNSQKWNTYTSFVQTQKFKNKLSCKLSYIKAAISGPNSKLILRDSTGASLAESAKQSSAPTDTYNGMSTYIFSPEIDLNVEDYSFEVVNGTAHLVSPDTYIGDFIPDSSSDMKFEVHATVVRPVLVSSNPVDLQPINLPIIYKDNQEYTIIFTETLTEKSLPETVKSAQRSFMPRFHDPPSLSTTQNIFTRNDTDQVEVDFSNVDFTYTGRGTLTLTIDGKENGSVVYGPVSLTPMGLQQVLGKVFKDSGLSVGTYTCELKLDTELYPDVSVELPLIINPVADITSLTFRSLSLNTPATPYNSDIPMSSTDYYTCIVYNTYFNATYDFITNSYGTPLINGVSTPLINGELTPLTDGVFYNAKLRHVQVVDDVTYTSAQTQDIPLGAFYSPPTLSTTQNIFPRSDTDLVEVNFSNVSRVYSGPGALTLTINGNVVYGPIPLSALGTISNYSGLSVGTYLCVLKLDTELYPDISVGLSVAVNPVAIVPEAMGFYTPNLTGDAFPCTIPQPPKVILI